MSEDVLRSGRLAFAKTCFRSHVSFLDVAEETEHVFGRLNRDLAEAATTGSSGSAQPPATSSSSSGSAQPPATSISSGSAQPSLTSSSGPALPPASSTSCNSSSNSGKRPLTGTRQPTAKRLRQGDAVVPEELRSERYSASELIEMRAEHDIATEMELSWQDRGPPGEKGAVWRGQEWRVGSQRYANRGGRCKEWYAAFYNAKKLGKEELKRWLSANPKPS